MSLEWQLDDSAEEAVSHHYENVNPRKVFLLALAAALVTVAIGYFALQVILALIASGVIPSPPALSQYVS